MGLSCKADVMAPNMMLRIARNIVKYPRVMNPIGSQLNGVLSRRIRDGQDSEMNTLIVGSVGSPAKVMILVTTK